MGGKCRDDGATDFEAAAAAAAARRIPVPTLENMTVRMQ
jgi:hypothetical protein